jgi:sucrose phosphorylase
MFNDIEGEKKPVMEELIYALHNPEPDYTRPLFEIPSEVRERMLGRLRFLYGDTEAKTYMSELERILRVYYAHKPQEMIEAEKDCDPKERFTEKDMILITYGDMLLGEEGSPLSILHKLINTYNWGAVNTIHILPFFPYSSDKGFSIKDFSTVDPRLGTWDDIREITSQYQLMFDGVLNHASSKSKMFKEFLNGHPYYKDFFISYHSPDDLSPDQRSKIFRPRTSDILTKFQTIAGPRYLWTTFSEDQIDLNFRNPAVLMRIIEGLLFYVRQGANIIRLDAVTYIWAEPGTECVHLPETHEIVKLLRDVMDTVAPGVALVTETNVPQEDNISYFGNGYDEAHMVYNFALPPLVLHTFYREDSTTISNWAQNLKEPSKTATFFNMLDTHDGIGLMGVKGILPKEDIDSLIQKAKERGALISYKMTENHTEDPYEINSTWWSVINGDECDEDMAFQVKRYIATRSITMVLQGVPAAYIHGIVGTGNDHELVKKTGVKRDVNRGVIDSKQMTEALKDPHSKNSYLRQGNRQLTRTRTSQRAFHPHGDQRVLIISPDIFTVFRTSPEGDQHILTMTNVTNKKCTIEIPLSDLTVEETRWYDLLNKKEWKAEKKKLSITLQPYDVVWLKPHCEME